MMTSLSITQKNWHLLPKEIIRSSWITYSKGDAPWLPGNLCLHGTDPWQLTGDSSLTQGPHLIHLNSQAIQPVAIMQKPHVKHLILYLQPEAGTGAHKARQTTAATRHRRDNTSISYLHTLSVTYMWHPALKHFFRTVLSSILGGEREMK